MGKQRLVVLSAILAVALLGGVAWEVMSPGEPSYQGEPLHYWLSAYAWAGYADTSQEKKPTVAEADEAINAIGTNAIPALLRLLHQRDSPLKYRIYGLVRRQHFIRMRYPSAALEGKKAMAAFYILGPRATNALTALSAIYDENPSPTSRQLLVVIAVYIDPHGEQTVPFLLRALTDTNDVVLRYDAARALGNLHVKPEITVTALTSALNDPHPLVQAGAVHALGEFGASARPAIPALLKFLPASGTPTGPSVIQNYVFGTVAPSANFYAGIGYEVTSALENIDPDALRRHGK